jgi:hypothetical protein
VRIQQARVHSRDRGSFLQAFPQEKALRHSLTVGTCHKVKSSLRALIALEKTLGGKPMSQRFALGATLLLPETVCDFTNPLGGIPFVLNEPRPLDLREAFRIVFRRKS